MSSSNDAKTKPKSKMYNNNNSNNIVFNEEDINYEKQYPLHAAIIKNDLEAVFQILEETDININERDHRGNPPLHLAIHLINKEIFYLLLERGADTNYKNGGGWSPLQESIASGDRELVEELFKRATIELNSRFERIIPLAISALEDLPNFYMEMSWNVGSWIPLVSKLCPYDKYKIWKHGNRLRIDTTLIGFENLQWVRGNVSFLFNGSATTNNSHIVIVNHDKKKVEYAFESFKKYAVNQNNPHDVNSLLAAELNRMHIRTDKVTFSKVKGWFGPPKKEIIGEWNAMCYDVIGVERLFIKRVDTRKIDKKTNNPRPPVSKDDIHFSFQNYFHSPISKDEPKGIGLIYAHESRKIRVKEHKGRIWMCNDFPVSVKQILPIFSLLSPSGKHFEKLEEFITMKLPDDGGFPVKIEIPIFPTINATVTFGVFDESEEINEEVFEIPEDYELLTNRSMLFSNPPRNHKKNNNNNVNNVNSIHSNSSIHPLIDNNNHKNPSDKKNNNNNKKDQDIE